MRRSIETTLYILHCCELFIPEKVFSASRLHSLYCLIHVNMSDYSEDNLYNCPLQNTFQCTGCHCIVCCGRSECTVPLLYPALTHSATLRIYSIQYIIMLLEPIHRAKIICQHYNFSLRRYFHQFSLLYYKVKAAKYPALSLTLPWIDFIGIRRLTFGWFYLFYGH